jgi:glucokinase
MYLVFDIGGTRMRFAVSKDGVSFMGDPVVVPTPKVWDEALPVLERVCKHFTDIQSVSGGLPGILDAQGESFVRLPNLPDWENKSVKRFFEDAFGVPVALYNDAALAGVGEATRGSGKGYRIVAFLTVGTGVGGARIVGGMIDAHHDGFEPGQQILSLSDFASLESLVSGGAFTQKHGKDFFRIISEDLWLKAADILAVGVHNTIVHWSPDVVVIGGSMITKQPGIPLAAVRKRLGELMHIFPTLPPIVEATLGEGSGLAGALMLAVRKQ